jgi:tetratricopeptide (TPR) repeat protein
VLPEFVRREHDTALQQSLKRIAAGTTTELVVIRGGSCTGKTRTAYEAITEQIPDWQLLHPKDQRDLLAVLDVGPLAPQSILWLDDLHNFLETDAEENAAAGLRRLLDSPASAVLIATIWPEPYQRLTDTPSNGQPDPHHQARLLMRGAQLIQVPNSFAGTSLADLQHAAKHDASLAMALRTATDDEVCQTLAAGPDLLDHWQHAENPYAKALIAAAIDARRLGLRTSLSGAFLRTAAPGYLTAGQRSQASTTWYEEALLYALRPVKQVTSALRAVLSPTGMGALPDQYDLADYLEQATDRRRPLAPATFWDAAVGETTPSVLRTMADRAQDRALYFDQARLLQACLRLSQTAPDNQAFGSFLQSHGFAEEAEAHLKVAAAADNVRALLDLATAAEKQGHIEQALAWHKQAWAAGNERAYFSVFWLLRKHHRWDEAESWIRLKAADDWADATRLLANLLAERSRLDEAEQVLWPLARDNKVRPCRRDFVHMLYAAGRTDRIHELLDPLAQAGDEDAGKWLSAVRVWNTNSEQVPTAADSAPQTAPMTLRTGAQIIFEPPGHPSPQTLAMRQASTAQESGDLEQAVIILRAALPAQDWRFMQKLSGLLEAQQRWTEAIDVWRDACEDGNFAALMEIVEILVRSGRHDDAEALLRHELVRGPQTESWNNHPPALSPLRDLLKTVDRDQEAQGIEQYGLRPDGTTSAPWTPRDLDGPRPTAHAQAPESL